MNVIDIDGGLRLIGTAHISSQSVNLVKDQIEAWEPDVVAVELCQSRLSSLLEPEAMGSEDLLKIIGEGRSLMILLQSALAAQQRKMGLESGEVPGAELLAAVTAAENSGVPVELIDRDVVITLRRAWSKMGIFEKWRVLNALLWDEDEEDVTIDEILGDSDLLSSMMEEARSVAPRAGEVLIDERDAFLAGRIQQIREKGKVLAVIGAGHLTGVEENLRRPSTEVVSELAKLGESPKKSNMPKLVMGAIPLLLIGALVWMGVKGDVDELMQTAKIWIFLNASLAGFGVMIARGHPISIIVGAIASPITSLNPMVGAGWFAGYTQLKVASPTGKDAQDFLILDEVSLFWKNRVGRVLMVTALGNMGSAAGAILAGSAIIGLVIS